MKFILCNIKQKKAYFESLAVLVMTDRKRDFKCVQKSFSITLLKGLLKVVVFCLINYVVEQ